MSCRGWSSDAYLAARLTADLTRRGHEVWLGCRRGTEAQVIDRARAEGVERVVSFAFSGGLAPGRDAADVRRLLDWLPRVDIVHVHRGKEHWLAALANRLTRVPRPVIRTRHIVQAVRPHPANRWLYRSATALVHTVSEAIRQQYIAADLVSRDRVVALPGGVDVDRYRPATADARLRARLGADGRAVLVGMVGGLRVMKGHDVVLEAVAALAGGDPRMRLAFVGTGSMEARIRASLARHRLDGHVAMPGFVADPAPLMAAFDIALYVPLESEGMSRVAFEYLAAGCPLIASRVGVVPEVLRDREHALLVPGGDAPALGAALGEMLGDVGLRHRLAEAGRSLVVERYSGARLAAALERCYVRVAAR
jgi:glycosyltransferase involved in cell wall biosynthesis